MTDKVLIQIQTILILLGAIFILFSISTYIQWTDILSLTHIKTQVIMVFGTIKNALNCVGVAIIGAILIIAGANIK